MKILFIQTGGTIDKDYSQAGKTYDFEISEPAIERILLCIAVGFEYEIFSLLKKDSMDLTNEDRQEIHKVCEETPYDKIIITHGTDTMPETARTLADIKGKTIVLTGAARPERFSNSDAAFNIGTAIGAINMIKDGVFIAMNGRIFPYDNVQKNQKTGQFEPLSRG